MAKKKTTPETENTTPEVVSPVEVAATDSPKAKQTMLEIPDGYVLITGLNEDGTEKEGSAFFYPEKSYARIYGDEAKYSVKKKQ